ISLPPLGEEDGTEGPMMIEAEMGDSAQKSKIQMVPAATPLVGFSGEIIWHIGQILLLVKIGPGTQQPVINQVTEEKIKVAIHLEYSEQTIAIGSTLTKEGRTKLCGLLRHNLDIFAWKPTNMTGIPRHIAEHNLNIHEGCIPVRQKKMGKDLREIRKSMKRLKKLVNTSIMKEVHYYSWLSNPVMKGTKKKDFQWIVEAETAFEQIKKLIAKLLMLAAPKEKEELIIYPTAAKEAISAVLMTERDGKQVPNYFNSRALQGPEINYTPMENMIPALANCVLREIHEGSCSMHVGLRSVVAKALRSGLGITHSKIGAKSYVSANALLPLNIRKPMAWWKGPRSVVAKAIRLGYFWPTMHKDAQDMIRKCSDCQIHRPVTRHPQQPLTPITALWPFYKWGIDIAGPFPEGPGKVKFLIVAMDYFTKWIEAKAVATITGGQVKKFVWDNIVCRFGIPGEIISDNERANRSLGEGIKARLGEGNKNWVEELPHVFWDHRTMIKSSHGDTPFSLAYRTKAVIPAEIGMPIYRITTVDVVNNDEELRLNLDLLEERRELAAMSEARSKSKIMKYYNSRVRGVAFKPGDFVYRSNDASHAVAGGKLGPK
nr:reverse transcriptase domain-containing protein [Tanacetum cinerariifolium]